MVEIIINDSVMREVKNGRMKHLRMMTGRPGYKYPVS